MKKERPCERNETWASFDEDMVGAGSCGAHLVAVGACVGPVAVEFATKAVAEKLEGVAEVLVGDAHLPKPLILGATVAKRKHVLGGALRN